MKKRALSLLLAMVMLLSVLPVSALADVGAERVLVDAAGQPVAEVLVPELVTDAYPNPVVCAPEGETYQWQLAVNDDLWVSITGDTERSITLTYAKVNSLLSGGTVDLRCLVDGEAVGPITVATVLPELPEAVPAGESIDLPLEVLSGPISLGDVAELQDDPANTVTITIHYWLKEVNGDKVADDYVAQISTGEDFDNTIVKSPTVVGYLPYKQGDSSDYDVDASQIVLNYTNLQNNVFIDVVYLPTNVNYTVYHYQQNVDNDQYSLQEKETRQGLTGSTVPDVAKSYPGFYALVYEKPAIAADGSTEIEVYYDRNYYLVNFNLDGGYGTEPVYARYGAPLGTVNKPQKAGYTFAGWADTADGTAVTLPTTVPAGNKTFYAIWTPDDTAKVTLVFWGENADDENYSYLGDSTKIIYLKPGTEFTYSEDKTLICGKEQHTHTDCTNLCGKEQHTHSELGGSCYTSDKCTHTQHTIDCYSVETKAFYSTSLVETTKPAESLTDAGNGIYTYTSGWTTYYYLSIGDKWYCGHKEGNFSGREEDDASLTITFKCSHTHSDECYQLSCGKEEHVHTLGCYSCGKEEHTHTDVCYMQGAGLSSEKWKFVKSDTVTVAADGTTVVNVYYDRTTFTLHFRNANSSTDNYGTIEEKWGANIRTKYNEKTAQSGTALWSLTKNGNSPWTAFLDIMPDEERIYYANSSNSNETVTANYYGEPLSGSDLDTLYTSTAKGSGYTVGSEDKVAIEGFTYVDSLTYNNETYRSTSNGSSFNGAKFYYKRNTFKIEYNNYVGSPETKSAKYGASLDNDIFNWTPTDAQAPAIYEPGSVTFGGWYLNPQCTGQVYDFTGKTMPVGPTNTDGEIALALYAKWVPVTHTVTFYLDKDAYEAGTKLESHPAVTVSHNAFVDPTPADPTNGKYTFVGWFYMDNGVEKAIDFANMPITKDLDVYGKWSSNSLVQYTVQFVEQGTTTKVADDITGSGLAGTTKTFDAKGGTELYEYYQECYFPTVQSQSLTLDIESNSLVLTFEYVRKDAVPYTVRYLEKDTNKVLHEEKYVSDNRKAVVTETFVQISGYVPDAYQKRLVITAEGENVLIFYYTADTTHALYQVVHYVMDDNDVYQEYSNASYTGDIGTRYTASALNALTSTGYKHQKTIYKVNGADTNDITAEGVELTENGLSIELYYDPTCYVIDFALPYKINDTYSYTPNSSFLTTTGFAKINNTGYRFYPASNVLYEENFFTADGYTDGYVTWERETKTFGDLNLTDSVYGYDTAYANATGAQGFYSVSGLNADNLTGKLRTTFYGNGFDLIGNCDKDTGRVLMLIKGAKSYLYDVDTRYTQGSLTQVPLVHAELAAEGKYDVIISAGYLAPVAAKSEEQSLNAANAFSLSGSDAAVEQLLAENGLSISQVEYITVSTEDNLTASAASVSVNGTAETNDWEEVTEFEAGTHVEIDAFRVYRSSDNKRYAENEQNVVYKNILDVVEGKTVTAYTEGGNVTGVSVEDYQSKGGPQRELYLDKGQSVVFGVGNAESVQVSLRAVSGATTWNETAITSNTEMYYQVTASADGTFTITNNGDNLLAIGNVKLKAGTETTATASYSTEVLLRSVRAAMGDAPVESEPQYDPFVDVKVRSTSLLRKKLVTLTITTSTDVETLTVNGYKLYPVNKWMVQSGRATTYTYILADTVSKNTTKTYEITAVNANGQSCTVTKEA